MLYIFGAAAGYAESSHALYAAMQRACSLDELWAAMEALCAGAEVGLGGVVSARTWFVAVW